jgi:hypothetical protein
LSRSFHIRCEIFLTHPPCPGLNKLERELNNNGLSNGSRNSDTMLEIIKNKYVPNSSLQNRPVRWGLPLDYKHLSRPSHIRCGTLLTIGLFYTLLTCSFLEMLFKVAFDLIIFYIFFYFYLYKLFTNSNSFTDLLQFIYLVNVLWVYGGSSGPILNFFTELYGYLKRWILQ